MSNPVEFTLTQAEDLIDEVLDECSADIPNEKMAEVEKALEKHRSTLRENVRESIYSVGNFTIEGLLVNREEVKKSCVEMLLYFIS